MKNNEPILIAKIISPHGLQGGATIISPSFRETILKKGLKVFLCKANENLHDSNLFEIEKVNIGNKIIVYFKNLNSINQLEKIIPCNIYLPKESFPVLSGAEYYWIDLLECQVFDQEKNQIIGTLSNIYENGAQSVFVIKKTDGCDIEIPYVNQFVKKIDIDKKIIEIIEPKYIE